MSRKTPTNIITGFLGTGKTTTILELLKAKPANENWAVLVNEFGEIGIDGAMMSDSGALIKEVPGGCICCTAGVPTSVAITALLRSNPDRLIIEPTGLGHPKQIMATLSSSQFSPYIELRSTLTLTDARYFDNDKYTTNANFKQQLEVADIIIANKSELAAKAQVATMHDWLQSQDIHSTVINTTRGDIEPSLLDMFVKPSDDMDIEEHHHHHAALEPQFQLPPNQTHIRKENKGQGYFSCGWLFGAEMTFDFDSLFSMLSDLTADRVKAVMNTDKGCYAFNKADGVLSVNDLSLEGFESRIEVIDTELMPWNQLEEILLNLAGGDK
ncbi:CobW family GTP-binding protein [Vibrio breoganii]|uniref:CobW family GTP-binding protein n=1 Tax=Vibrio breoganii TaxID=553239 RepID=UPI0010BDE322|nr:GTP-binding protein [Vibrio breoganii]TKG23457.1 GTP-binding protein [Vibrio breoganii]